MKTILTFLCCLVAAAAPPSPPPAPPPADPWPDTLVLAKGATVRCRILTATPASLLIDYPRPGPGRQPALRRDVPWTDLASADFAMDDDFHRLVAAGDPLQDIPRLTIRWTALAPLLGRPHHPAGALGLTLARLSLSHPDTAIRRRALDVCRAMAAGDWNEARRHEARLLDAQLRMSLGRTDEALRQARALAAEPAITPHTAMLAHVMLAEADFTSLRKLEDENPRWIEDDTVRPEREALFHQTLESALKPSLFHGTLEEPASQGLWTAVQVLEFDRNLPAAAEAARDLIHLYPSSPPAGAATAFLRRNRLPLDPAGEPAADPLPSAAAAPESTPAAPAPAAREPIVHRRTRYTDTPRPPGDQSAPTAPAVPGRLP
jgi:hypothetical protein